MLDLNTFDHVENNVYYDMKDFFDQDKYTEYKEIIFNQLENFNNLGTDLFKETDMEDDIKEKIFQDIIMFVNENYLNLPDKDFVMNKKHLENTGFLCYQFLCVDCFNIIIPKILEALNIQNMIQLEKVLARNVGDINYIKKLFLNNISEIITNLNKLEDIDKQIHNDEKYKALKTRFANYLEMIDFSNSIQFTENFLKPLINKNFDQLLWRTL